jgi:hypothetical protein
MKQRLIDEFNSSDFPGIVTEFNKANALFFT